MKNRRRPQAHLRHMRKKGNVLVINPDVRYYTWKNRVLISVPKGMTTAEFLKSDFDLDGVINAKDCKPFDPKKHSLDSYPSRIGPTYLRSGEVLGWTKKELDPKTQWDIYGHPMGEGFSGKVYRPGQKAVGKPGIAGGIQMRDLALYEDLFTKLAKKSLGADMPRGIVEGTKTSLKDKYLKDLEGRPVEVQLSILSKKLSTLTNKPISAEELGKQIIRARYTSSDNLTKVKPSIRKASLSNIARIMRQFDYEKAIETLPAEAFKAIKKRKGLDLDPRAKFMKEAIPGIPEPVYKSMTHAQRDVYSTRRLLNVVKRDFKNSIPRKFHSVVENIIGEADQKVNKIGEIKTENKRLRMLSGVVGNVDAALTKTFRGLYPSFTVEKGNEPNKVIAFGKYPMDLMLRGRPGSLNPVYSSPWSKSPFLYSEERGIEIIPTPVKLGRMRLKPKIAIVAPIISKKAGLPFQLSTPEQKDIESKKALIGFRRIFA